MQLAFNVQVKPRKPREDNSSCSPTLECFAPPGCVEQLMDHHPAVRPLSNRVSFTLSPSPSCHPPYATTRTAMGHPNSATITGTSLWKQLSALRFRYLGREAKQEGETYVAPVPATRRRCSPYSGLCGASVVGSLACGCGSRGKNWRADWTKRMIAVRDVIFFSFSSI
jgi:hypothetical protein